MSLPTPGHRREEPDAIKGGPARVKDLHRVELAVRHHAGRRYPANPMLGSLPCPNRRRIIHANRPIFLDDSPSSRGDLPFQSIAGQSFAVCSLPHVAPEIFSSFGALTRLDPVGHALEFVPRPWRMIIPIFAQKIRSIL